MSDSNVQQVVKEKYSELARQAQRRSRANSAPSAGCCDSISTGLYDLRQTEHLPDEALLASLGCGNPTALAKLNPGEIVLDLGCGGGIDVLLSAQRVGPTGKAYGLDMTDEMLALANENKRKAGAENVEFLKGEIENIPLPDNSVDVVISNCVINLSADKGRVLREAFRVLKPGGRFAVSDVVTRGEIPPEIRKNMLLWVGCVAGALEEREYRGKLGSAGFEDIGIEPTRVYRAADAQEFLAKAGIDKDAIAANIEGKIFSAFIRAVKPASAEHTRSSNVLFLCTGNSSRSIMAEAILNQRGRPNFVAYSAGSHPRGIIHSAALKQLEAAGVPTAGLRSKSWDEFAEPGAPKMAFIFTLCDDAAREACPIWPGQPMTAHWGLPDPGNASREPGQIERAFQNAYMILDRRICLFLALPLSSLEKAAIERGIENIGKQ